MVYNSSVCTGKGPIQGGPLSTVRFVTGSTDVLLGLQIIVLELPLSVHSDLHPLGTVWVCRCSVEPLVRISLGLLAGHLEGPRVHDVEKEAREQCQHDHDGVARW